jgi:hypothetical protein
MYKYKVLMFSVTLYSCGGLAEGDCSFCRNLELTRPDMNCRWCGGECIYSNQTCSVSRCPRPSITSVSRYLCIYNNQTCLVFNCPRPSVISMNRLSIYSKQKCSVSTCTRPSVTNLRSQLSIDCNN